MPTALSKTKRYIAPGVSKVYFFPACANILAPTRAEFDAGLDHTAEIAAMAGWEIRADRVAAPDLGTPFTGRTTGRTNPGDAQITYYGSKDTQDVRQILTRGDTGFFAILDGGDVAGQLGRCFAVELAAITPMIAVEGTENARVVTDWAISDVAESFTIPV